MSVLSIDFETYATADLKKTGVYPYAEHPNTGIWMMAWAFGNEEPQVWYPPRVAKVLGIDSPFPQRILDHIAAGGEIRAWNAQFERIVWREIMHKRLGFPNPTLEQWVDTAAEAAAMALPRSLDQCALVMGLKEKKDSEGYALMMRMTRPRKVLEDGTPIWWDVPERIERLAAYCAQDVRVERAIVPNILRLPPRERDFYLLDQRMNDRGIRVDTELVTAARTIADRGIASANLVMRELTGGKVNKVMDHTRLRDWLREQGMDIDSVAKKAVREMLEADLPALVREAVELRADAGRTSLAKLDSMLAALGMNGKLRGLLLYHGAGTGRWAGKLVQPHNFPRGEIDAVESYIDAVLGLRYDELNLFHHPVVIVVSMLRSMLTATPGNELIAGDFSAIEARVTNWVAGQEDVLENFRLYDAGDKSRDVYKRMAVQMGRGATVADVTKDDRQAGKAAELGCGFQMGATKFKTAAWDVYYVRLTDEEAERAVKAYRETHPRVVEFWGEANRAAIDAVAQPGVPKVFGALRNLRFVKLGPWLYLRLPSGRVLAYAQPKIVERVVPWSTPEKPETRPAVEFSGQDSQTRRWMRMHLYGGLITENLVQAIARDLMAEAMDRVDRHDYPAILSVHDEVVSEVPEGFGSVAEYEKLLAELPAWAAGCPVKAEGWRGFRYRK